MGDLTGIRFRPADRVQYYDSDMLDLSVGDKVLVETDTGDQTATVVIAPDQVIHSDLRGPMLRVLKKIDED